MLGKGLESLIPQKGGSGDGSDDVSVKPPASEPEPALLEPAAPVAMTESAAPAAPVAATEPTATFQPNRQATPPTVFQKSPEEKESVFHIEIDNIKPNPNQPRRNFDEASLRDLAHSIREFGFLQPLVVSKIEKETPTGIAVEYQLIAGERRFMAAKMLGLMVVPAIIRKVDHELEKLELAVIENIQRENLNPIETARAFQRLQEEFRMTQREIAAKLGKSREAIANAVRLLDLPEFIRVAVEKGELSESHARLLLTVQEPSAQKHLFEDITQRRLTTREVKERVEHMGIVSGARRGRPPKSAEHLPPELQELQETLSAELGAPVEIHQGQAKGSITITFYSEEELKNIMQRFGKEN